MRRWYLRSWDEAHIVKGEDAKECDVQQNEKYILLHIASSKALTFHEISFEGIEYERYIILLHIALPNNLTFHCDFLQHLTKYWQIRADHDHLRFNSASHRILSRRLPSELNSAYQAQKYSIGVAIT
jgi:hypothetical protein